jgi:hypothetical protein
MYEVPEFLSGDFFYSRAIKNIYGTGLIATIKFWLRRSVHLSFH